MFVAAVPLQAVWTWRPQLWVTGPTEAGKSLLMRRIAGVLGPTAHLLERQATEAGIRQTLGLHSDPLLLDEFERVAAGHRPRILDFLRSAGTGGFLVRGTPSQQRVQFEVTCMALVASIEVSLDSAADAGRFLVLPLESLGQRIAPPGLPRRELGAAGSALLAGLLGRFDRALRLESELADLAGAPLHGRQALGPAVPVAAAAAVLGLGDSEARERFLGLARALAAEDVVDRDPDHVRLLRNLLSAPLPENRAETLGQAFAKWRHSPSCLERFGLRPAPDHRGVFIAVTPALRQLLNGTRWEGLEIGQILARAPGACRGRQRLSGPPLRGVTLPWDLLGLEPPGVWRGGAA
jgi:hypothetical protein